MARSDGENGGSFRDVDARIAVTWNDEAPLAAARLGELLREFGDLLPRPLAGRMDLDAYAAKLLERGEVACATLRGQVVGIAALYANDARTRRAHVPLLAVSRAHRGAGIGAALLSRAKARARQRGMSRLELEVRSSNTSAQRLFRAGGLVITGAEGDGLRMRCELPGVGAPLAPTPLESWPRLADALGLDLELRAKRDDLYASPGGGSKARKARHIFREVLEGGHDVVVTTGGPQSNHARACALLAAELGIDCHLVIVLEPGAAYPDAGNVLLMRLAGATMEFCAKDELAARMDEAVARYRNAGRNPKYVWGGGHCLAGTVAFVEAAAEARAQCGEWRPEVLLLASATGSTQAGLAIGYAGLPVRVVGISVARDRARGLPAVQECVDEYLERSPPSAAGRPDVALEFRDEWTEGGYERTSPALLEIVERAAKVGVLVDPTYSGKALRGLVELVRRREFAPGSRVLFWHSGGLMNLQASELSRGSIAL
jgi:1-aminocyclopropane-1-carboxylate deaminase/D-cysteine desulfhydrase-like pyridoxal-dependent ACC family enzyme/GNAT superfamily N-acetyltransferase